MPADAEDERLLGRFKTLLKKARSRTATAPEQTTELPGSNPDALPSTGSPEGQQNATEQGPDVFEDADLQALWNGAVESDQTYGRLKNALREGVRRIAEESKVSRRAFCAVSFTARPARKTRNWIHAAPAN